MKRLAATFAILLLLSTSALAAKPKVGDIIPDAEVKSQLTPADAIYLGLPSGETSFRLSQIKADALLVEIFSMYCPICQVEAPAINRVFEKLATSPQGQRLKFLAIGAGNSPFEVNFFRKKNQALMPMLQDADYSLHKAFMAVGTPSFFLLKRVSGGKGFRVLLFQQGAFETPEAFLGQVLNAAALR